MRARYGVSVVNTNSYLCSTSQTRVLYAISRCTRPRYNGTWLYIYIYIYMNMISYNINCFHPKKHQPCNDFGFRLAACSRVLCWKLAITRVNLFWWPDGETCQSNINTIYFTPGTIFYCICTRLRPFWSLFVMFFPIGPPLEWYEIYVTPAAFMSLQRMTYAIYVVTYMGNIWP